MSNQTTNPNLLDLETALQAARSETGLSDFGAPDVRVPLSVMINSLNDEAQLNAAGAAGMRVTIHRALVNRLRVQDAVTRHPEIRDEKIRGPIVIVGLPRSGTTKLQRMLSSDSGLQKLPLWKIANPAPFPDAKPGAPDPRIAYAEAMVDGMRTAAPKFYAAHPMLAEEPDEEIFMMLMTFISSIPMHSYNTPSYRKWMVEQDCTEWYGLLRLLMQYLQWQDGSPDKPWVLKAPWHFRWMPTLFKTFPDATIVHCYRDPTQTIPSMASLFDESRKLATDIDRPHAVGELVMDYWGNATRSFVNERAQMNAESRFVDVPYTKIVADPLPVLDRIYAAAGLPLSDAAKAAMLAWETNNPQDKHGKHVYSMEHFGLSAPDIKATFSGYIDRFHSLMA